MAGPYSHLIIDMINNLQTNSGKPFQSQILNKALERKILQSNNRQGTIGVIKSTINKNIKKENISLIYNKKDEIYNEISKTILPKFIEVMDNFNGLGITVHDITATKIAIPNSEIIGGEWSADIHYQCQDHFGLDDFDIMKIKFKQHRFFRIWFILQRYKKFGFKPFMTNMEATVKIGDRFYE